MEERPRLDLGFDSGRQDRVALAGRHLNAGKPHDGLADAIHLRREAHAGNGLQRLVVEIGDALVAGQRLVDASELRLADRRLQVGDPVVEADLFVPIGAVGRHAVIAQHAPPLGELADR